MDKFKIMKDTLPCKIDSVPMKYVKQFEKRAEANHSQSIEKLNNRGGLSPREFYCLVNGLSIRCIIDGTLKEEDAIKFLETLKFENENELSKFTDDEIREEFNKRLKDGKITVEQLFGIKFKKNSENLWCPTCNKEYTLSQNCDCKETGCKTCGGLKLIPGRVYGYAGPVCQCGVRHQFNGTIE